MPRWAVNSLVSSWYPEFLGTFDDADVYYYPEEPNHYRGVAIIRDGSWRVVIAREGPIPITALAALRVKGLV